MCSYKLAK